MFNELYNSYTNSLMISLLQFRLSNLPLKYGAPATLITINNYLCTFISLALKTIAYSFTEYALVDIYACLSKSLLITLYWKVTLILD